MEQEETTLRGYIGDLDSDSEYYSLTLTANEDGVTTWESQTHFVGWADGKPGAELRKPRIVDPHGVLRAWQSMGRMAVVVNTKEQFAFYMFHFGGVALVERSVAEECLADQLTISECVREGFGSGFSSEGDIVQRSKKRFAPPKARMEILRRDGYRCGICGRGPDDSEDLRLHLHHIQEHSRGGPTLPWNLITLCQTCHEGLGPEERFVLHQKMEDRRAGEFDPDNEYRDGVRRYREVMEKFRAKEVRRRR